MHRPAVLALLAAGACSFQFATEARDDAVPIDVPGDRAIDAALDGPTIDAMIDGYACECAP